MADIAKFVEEIKSMTVLELNELVKAIEEEFGRFRCRSRLWSLALALLLRLLEEKTEFDVVFLEVCWRKQDQRYQGC